MNAPLVLRDSFSVNDEIIGGLGKTNGFAVALELVLTKVLRFVKLLTCVEGLEGLEGFKGFEGIFSRGLSLDISIQSDTIFL
jgi:hypothetical protein